MTSQQPPQRRRGQEEEEEEDADSRRPLLDQSQQARPVVATIAQQAAAASESTAAASSGSAPAPASSGGDPRGRQPSRDDAILSVSKVLHRHILHSRADQEARDCASRTHSGGSARTPRRARNNQYGSTSSTPRSYSRSSFDQSPSSYGSNLTPPPPSHSLNSPAIGTPYFSLATPPQMATDLDAAPHKFDKDIFDIDHYLARSYAVQVPLVTRVLPISVFEQKRQYHFVPVPTVEHVHKFIKRIFDQARLNAECVIIALIYIERMMETRYISLTRRNWLPVVSTALLTASKVWDDAGAINAEFAAILPIFTLQQVNAMERTFLTTISFELYISSAVYAQYYFGLRKLQDIPSKDAGTIPRAYHAPTAAAVVAPDTATGSR